MKLSIRALAASILLVGGMEQAKAGLVYDNGPVNGVVNAWTISLGHSASDSFTIGSSTTLTEAQVGLWAFSLDVPTVVQWLIGSLPYTADLGTGIAALSSAMDYTNQFRDNVYTSTFQLSGSFTAGTYWLTLENAMASSGEPVFWDQTGGSSLAFDSSQGAIPSESFQLYGSSVPEPGSLTLFGIGAVALITSSRWRSRPLGRLLYGPHAIALSYANPRPRVNAIILDACVLWRMLTSRRTIVVGKAHKARGRDRRA
jgi:hypothetical protein